jgi:hypothetical protein
MPSASCCRPWKRMATNSPNCNMGVCLATVHHCRPDQRRPPGSGSRTPEVRPRLADGADQLLDVGERPRTFSESAGAERSEIRAFTCVCRLPFAFTSSGHRPGRRWRRSSLSLRAGAAWPAAHIAATRHPAGQRAIPTAQRRAPSSCQPACSGGYLVEYTPLLLH